MGNSSLTETMLAWCYLASLVMTIPWSIWSFHLGLWPESEQSNYELVDWGRWYCTLVYAGIMLWMFYYCVIEGCCYNYTKTSDVKSAAKCRMYWFVAIFALQFILIGTASYMAVAGAIYLSNRNDGISTWAFISWLMMDIFLWIVFLLFAGLVIFCCYVACCNKSKSVHKKKEAGCWDHFVRNFMHYQFASQLHRASNKKANYSNLDHSRGSGYDQDIF